MRTRLGPKPFCSSTTVPRLSPRFTNSRSATPSDLVSSAGSSRTSRRRPLRGHRRGPARWPARAHGCKVAGRIPGDVEAQRAARREDRNAEPGHPSHRVSEGTSHEGARHLRLAPAGTCCGGGTYRRRLRWHARQSAHHRPTPRDGARGLVRSVVLRLRRSSVRDGSPWSLAHGLPPNDCRP